MRDGVFRHHRPRPLATWRIRFAARLVTVRSQTPCLDCPHHNTRPRARKCSWPRRRLRSGSQINALSGLMNRALQIRVDQRSLVDWDLWCIDRANVRAARGAGFGLVGSSRSSHTRATNGCAVTPGRLRQRQQPAVALSPPYTSARAALQQKHARLILDRFSQEETLTAIVRL